MSHCSLIIFITGTYHRYVKVGVSTEGEIKLQQRPATFQKDSEFLLMEHMPEELARSITDSLKFETFMFQQLEQAGIKKVGVEEKVSSRGIRLISV